MSLKTSGLSTLLESHSDGQFSNTCDDISVALKNKFHYFKTKDKN